MEEKPDIFDRIMQLPLLRVFNPLFQKHRETLLYLFFGVLSIAVNLLAYAVFERFLNTPLIVNILSWIVQVLFAFWTNSTWVFRTKTDSKKEKLMQLFSFSAGRLFSLFVEEGIIFVFITKLGFPEMLVKFIAQIIIAILNYIVSKLFVFRKKWLC